MKRKVKRMLAMFLTFIMVFSMGTVFVSAAEEGAGKSTETAVKPELSKKTADSVILKTKDGYVYGIQENGSTWKWAEDKQYDKTAKTVSFTGLKAETEYVFAQKMKDAETVQDTDILKVKTDAAAVQAETPKQDGANTESPKAEEPPKADKPQDEGMNTEQQKPQETNQTEAGAEGNKADVPAETPKPDDSKKQEENTEVSTPSGTDTTDKTQGTEAVDKNTAGDAVTDDNNGQKTDEAKKDEPKGEDTKSDGSKTDESKTDESKTDESKTDESKTDESKTDAGKDNDSGNQINNKNTTQKAETPKSPLYDKVTDTSVVLKPDGNVDSYTYSYKMVLKDNKAKAADLTSDTGEFSNLTPDTDYLAYIMVKGNDQAQPPYADSDWSQPTEIHTLKAAAEKPKAAPKLAEKTDTMIKLDTSTAGLEYGVYLDNSKISWNSEGEFKGLTAGKEYRFVTRVKFDEKEQMEGPISDVLKVTTKKAAAAAPEAPVCIGRTENSITLRAVNGQEYAMLENGNPGKWQDSEVFSGLKANTRYSFVTRVKYNPDEAMGSKVSGSSSAKTIIAFEGSGVTGIEVNGVYDKNAVVNIAANGNGTDNQKPEVQDTRWVPESWKWGSSAKGTWKKAPYTAKLTLNKAGKMELEVVFSLQEYTEKGWTAMTAEKKTITVPFSVKEQYTITASAGSNGKISPSGSVKVMEGNDATFTFTPNKGYQISQVTVDGKAVSVKNNKYTFEDVNANHKISVTFKTLTKTVPKTGDTMNMAGYLMLAVLSAGAALAVVISAKRKRTNGR